MEQEKPQPTRPVNKQLKLWNAVIAVSVAAILAFSALAAFYYTQAVDYRESKYRAQFQIVNEMVTFIPVENATIALMLDPSRENGLRRADALSGVRIADMLAGDAFALSVMYSEDDDRRSTFFSLGTAFSSLATALADGLDNLSSPTHTLSDDYVTMIRTATDIMTTILGHLKQGIRAGVDGIEEPYHVVGDMPLESIASAADALDEVLSCECA